MNTILLVDDYEIIRMGMKALLAEDPKIQVVGEASNGLDAIRLVRSLEPQLVIMDIQMPGIDGLEATRKIMRVNPSTKIIVISIFNEVNYPTRLLEAGAVGYLSKEASLQEVLKAIHTVLTGKLYISPPIAHKLACQCINNTTDLSLDILSLREIQVALMLLKGKEIKHIAETLFVSEKTVMGYRNSIFKKLHLQNAVQLILFAKQQGLLSSLII